MKTGLRNYRTFGSDCRAPVKMTLSRLNKQRCEIAEPSLGGQKRNSYKGCALWGETTFTALDVQKRTQISQK